MTKYYILVAKMGIMCHCAKFKTMHRQAKTTEHVLHVSTSIKIVRAYKIGLISISSYRK